MTGQTKYDYPPKDELQKLCSERGLVGAANALGIPRSSLQSHCYKIGVSPTKEVKVKPKKVEALPEEVPTEEVLRQRIAELEKMIRRDRKDQVYDERVTRAVEDAIRTAPPGYTPKPIKKRKASSEGHEFVLLLSDTHAAEIVSLEETNGINAYNWQIMLDRLDKLREGVVSFQRNRPYPIDRLRILLLGDMLSGDIHEELSETNEFVMSEATVKLGKDLANFTMSFEEHFQEILVDGIVGNHPRAKKKPQAKQGYNNADWTAYHIAALHCEARDRVKWDIPKANQHLVEICGRDCLLFHGDGIRSSMPGVPWGGVSRRVNALAAQYRSMGRDIYAYFCGHFHTANLVQTDAGWVGMNGAVKGPDEYSIKQFGGGRPAQQTLLTFHPEHGLTDFSVIDLAEVR